MRDDVNACGHSVFDQMARDLLGLFFRARGSEDDSFVGHLKSPSAVSRQPTDVERLAPSARLKVPCNQVGSCYPQRENFRLTPDAKEKSTEKLRSDPPEFCGYKVTEAVRKDGLKLVFDDGSWVCCRLSRTEPVVRVYSEAR